MITSEVQNLSHVMTTEQVPFAEEDYWSLECDSKNDPSHSN